ncbi:MAG: hypothetical protein P8K73_05570 [Methylophilaceae bacterium]|nr:hypothetical protein [Methylophilaceae bacterium]
MNTKDNIGTEISKTGILMDLDTSELMVIWSLRHCVSCSITGEDPKDLFKLCFEQHQLPDISALIEEVVYGIGEGTDDKGPIGAELCDHVHYGEFKVLEALYKLQNDKYEDANSSLHDYLKPNQARSTYKILNAFAAILERVNLIIPSRKQYSSDRYTH